MKIEYLTGGATYKVRAWLPGASKSQIRASI